VGAYFQYTVGRANLNIQTPPNIWLTCMHGMNGIGVRLDSASLSNRDRLLGGLYGSAHRCHLSARIHKIAGFEMRA